MSKAFTGVTIAIPTRNRSDLAISAIKSITNEKLDNVKILVSDNSTESQEGDKLEVFCQNFDDSQLQYIRPPKSMAMPEHWEWVRQQSFRVFHETHLIYLTDRMVFKTGELKRILQIIELFPDRVISYNHDTIDDSGSPVKVRQLPWTGKVFAVKSDFLISISSNATWHRAIPRMINCAVPKTTFDKIEQTFGRVFESISPDFCFAYKCLDLSDYFLFYDSSVIISYGIYRSNGNGVAKGVYPQDTKDFFALLKEQGIVPFDASPIPGLLTVNNAIIHEYCFVKERACSNKFVPINMPNYLQSINQEINSFENSELRQQMLSLFNEQSKFYVNDQKNKLAVSNKFRTPSLRKLFTKILMVTDNFSDNLPSMQITKNLKSFMNGKDSEWKTVSEAFAHLKDSPLKNRKGLSELEYTLDIKLPIVYRFNN